MSPRYSPRNPGPRQPTMQARLKEQDSKLATRYSCSTHAITYHTTDRKPLCPMCDLENHTVDVQESLKKLANQVELLHAENKRLRTQVDLVDAMREAIDIIGRDDLMFLKTVLYQWKIDRSIALKVTHGASRQSRKRAPNGFIAMPRDGDPLGYACTSLGGLAMAEYLEEAINTVGSAQAMVLLVRAMARHLPGATG